MLFVCENNQFATEVPFRYAAGQSRASPAAARPTACPASRWTATTCWRSTRPPARRSQRAPQRRGPDAARMQDLPHPAARRGHGRLHLSHREEVEEWKKRCPIRACGNGSSTKMLADESTLNRIDAEIGKEIEVAQAKAEASAWPKAESAALHIYAKSPLQPLSAPRPPARARSRTCRPRSKRSVPRWLPTQTSSCSVIVNPGEVRDESLLPSFLYIAGANASRAFSTAGLPMLLMQSANRQRSAARRMHVVWCCR